MTNIKPIEIYLSKQMLWPISLSAKKAPTDIIVVIPCHNEPDVISSIQSLYDNDLGDLNCTIIVVINHGISASIDVKHRNELSRIDLSNWAESIMKQEKNFHVETLLAYDLPDKKAGVGLARKIGMDAACEIYFGQQKDGIICCYDADSRCESNYLTEVYDAFMNSKVDAVSIHFEHPIDGDEFQENIYGAIIQYETHLRYFIEFQKELNLPFALQTVGSSMAVRASSYAKFGGMNQRKAGEDFYFLQKFIENGLVTELNTTKIIPSPRISDRVPFGTGRAIGDMLSESNIPKFFSYHPQSFWDLKAFIKSIPSLFTEKYSKIEVQYPEGVKIYLKSIDFESKVEESIKNTSSFENFEKRIYKHFNAFQLMKYLHFMRDHYYPNLPIIEVIELWKGIENVNMKKELFLLRKRHISGFVIVSN